MRLKPRLVTLLATAVGVTALFALTSSAALANVAAHWNVGATEAKWKGSLTLEAKGFSAVTCSSIEMTVGAYNEGTQGHAFIGSGGVPVISCPGGKTLELWREGDTSFNGTNYEVKFYVEEFGIFLASPFGTYLDSALLQPTAIVTNGTKSTPSKITFSKAPFGELGGAGGATLLISGTLTMTTESGGLLTLST